MSQTPCGVIQDLLPLYMDHCCSEESRQYVEAHLATCENCQKCVVEMKSIIPAAEPLPGEAEKKQTLKKGMKKLRKICLIFVLAVVIVAAVASAVVYQIRSTGTVKLDNLDELAVAGSFLEKMKAGDLEAAFAHFDIDAKREEWLTTRPDLFTEDMLGDLEADGLAKFLECGKPFVEAGLSEYTLCRTDRYSSDDFLLHYEIVVGGKTYNLHISVCNGKIDSIYGGNGSIPDPDIVTQMTSWSWYVFQDYTE